MVVLGPGLRCEAADFDRGAEAMTAGLAKPSVADTAVTDEGGAFRHELLMVALRTKRTREIAGERKYCGRSI